MGLDMYLYKRTFLWTGDYVNEDTRDSVTVTKGGQTHPQIKNNRIKYVVEEVGYWRKANHIHKFFVDQVQEGNDDCGEYKVSEEKLKVLLNVCKDVLEHKDEEYSSTMLPASEGFFFGGTEYDEYYYGSLIETIDIIESLFNENGEIDGDIYYKSSW